MGRVRREDMRHVHQSEVSGSEKRQIAGGAPPERQAHEEPPLPVFRLLLQNFQHRPFAQLGGSGIYQRPQGMGVSALLADDFSKI